MQEAGYDEDSSAKRAWKAVAKKNIKGNADTQLLEDVTDLVFLEHYMLEFVGKHPDYSEQKWLDISSQDLAQDVARSTTSLRSAVGCGW